MVTKIKNNEVEKEEYTLHVVGRHVSVTDAMKAYAIEKISKLNKFQRRILDVNITMDVQKLIHIVDFVVKLDHIKIKSRAESNDMYASIDSAIDKLQRQLTKYKEKLDDYHKHALSRSTVDMKVNVFKAPEEIEIAELNDEIEEENRKQLEKTIGLHPVVHEEVLSVKTLTLDEAIWSMEFSSDTFLIFRCEKDLKLKIIYRREEDENYGVIELNV